MSNDGTDLMYLGLLGEPGSSFQLWSQIQIVQTFEKNYRS